MSAAGLDAALESEVIECGAEFTGGESISAAVEHFAEDGGGSAAIGEFAGGASGEEQGEGCRLDVGHVFEEDGEAVWELELVDDLGHEGCDVLLGWVGLWVIEGGWNGQGCPFYFFVGVERTRMSVLLFVGVERTRMSVLLFLLGWNGQGCPFYFFVGVERTRMSVLLFFVGGGLVLDGDVEVSGEVAPDGVNVVGVVLCVVVFDDESFALDDVVVSAVGFGIAPPADADVVHTGFFDGLHAIADDLSGHGGEVFAEELSEHFLLIWGHISEA